MEIPSWGFKPTQNFVLEVSNKENVAGGGINGTPGGSSSSGGGGGGGSKDASAGQAASAVGGFLEFCSPECKQMSHLLTDYALSFTKEFERKTARLAEYRKNGENKKK